LISGLRAAQPPNRLRSGECATAHMLRRWPLSHRPSGPSRMLISGTCSRPLILQRYPLCFLTRRSSALVKMRMLPLKQPRDWHRRSNDRNNGLLPDLPAELVITSKPLIKYGAELLCLLAALYYFVRGVVYIKLFHIESNDAFWKLPRNSAAFLMVISSFLLPTLVSRFLSTSGTKLTRQRYKTTLQWAPRIQKYLPALITALHAAGMTLAEAEYFTDVPVLSAATKSFHP
jgi:hypothetical protein